MKYIETRLEEDAVLIIFSNEFEYEVPFSLCSDQYALFEWNKHLSYKNWYTSKVKADFLYTALLMMVKEVDPF